MEIPFFVLCIFLCFIVFIILKSFRHPSILMITWWMFWIVTIALYKDYWIDAPISFKIDIYFFVILYALSSILYSMMYVNSSISEPTMKTIPRFENSRRIVVFFCVSIILIILLNAVPFLVAFSLYQSGFNATSVREEFFRSSSIIMTPRYYFTNTFIVEPLVLFLSSISTYLVLEKKLNPVFILITFFSALFIDYTSGGRIAILRMMIFVFVTFVAAKGDTIKSFLKNRTGMVVMLICISLFYQYFNSVTTDRGFSEDVFERLDKSIVVYFTGSLAYMNTLKEQILNNYFTYIPFRYFLGGAVDTILWPLSILFGVSTDIMSSVSYASFTVTGANIGSDDEYNAFISAPGLFMLDVGYAGLIINTIVFGLVSANIYGKYRLRDFDTVVGYCWILVIYTIFMSLITWVWFEIKAWIAFVLIFALFRRYCVEKTGLERGSEIE